MIGLLAVERKVASPACRRFLASERGVEKYTIIGAAVAA